MSNPSPGYSTTVRGTAPAGTDVPGVMVGKVSDRTFLLHLGGNPEGVRRSDNQTR